MLGRSLIGAIVLAALAMPMSDARALDDAKYPNWKGQWRIIVPRLPGQNVRFDPSKPWGLGQQAPLTPEYQKVLEDSMADQANGGLGNYPTAQCLPGGMPRMMTYNTQEYIVTPETTYILLGSHDPFRRIFTDGRPWPTDADPTYRGYSIGHWVDEDGDGTYDMLEVETRNFRGPRAYDATGLPLHFDNQSIFKERFYLDKADQNILHDMVTVIDHALTRPWTVDKTFRRNTTRQFPNWPESFCEENAQIKIGKENYFLSGDGLLMPARKNQEPPNLKYFKQTQQ